MPLGDKFRHRHRRRIRPGDTFIFDEDRDELIEREEVSELPDPPDESVRGEPWGWTKGPPYPLGYQDFIDHPPHGYRNGDGDDDVSR